MWKTNHSSVFLVFYWTLKCKEKCEDRRGQVQSARMSLKCNSCNPLWSDSSGTQMGLCHGKRYAISQVANLIPRGTLQSRTACSAASHLHCLSCAVQQAVHQYEHCLAAAFWIFHALKTHLICKVIVNCHKTNHLECQENVNAWIMISAVFTQCTRVSISRINLQILQ